VREAERTSLGDDLAGLLREAHLRIRGLDAPEEMKAVFIRRLLAVTNVAKHDLATAADRLQRLLAQLTWAEKSG